MAQEFGYNEMLLAIYEILINSPVSNYFGSEEVAEVQHNYIQLKEELYEIRISEELAILEAARLVGDPPSQRDSMTRCIEGNSFYWIK